MNHESMHNDITVIVGKKIKSIRKKKGISAKELAEKSGLSVAFISRVENGHQSPTLSSLSKLADALDVPVVAFFSYL